MPLPDSWTWDCGSRNGRLDAGVSFLFTLISRIFHSPMNVVVRGLHYYAGKHGLLVGMRVVLHPEPSNRHDSNAVSVHLPEGRQIGHVNRVDAALLSPCLLDGMEVEAKVLSIHKGQRSGHSCVINLTIPEEFQHRLAARSPDCRQDCAGVPAQIPSPVPRSPKESACFVATVVFESPEHPSVEWLRWWRDNHLVKHAAGRTFIWVYRHLGPHFADLIKERPCLRPVLKQWIDQFVAWNNRRIRFDAQ